MRTSLAFWGQGDREPGWLVRCLSEFAFRGVNLSKIESRPLRSTIGHYRFFVDCDDGLASPAVSEAVDGLRTHCTEVRVLGSYPRELQVD
jgi:prephenate dehydratase